MTGPAKWIAPYCSSNLLTLLAMLTGIGVAIALLCHQVILSLLLLAISGYLDSLDGTVARLRGNTQPIGAVFDIVADRVVELSVIMGLFLSHPTQRAIVSFSMLGSVLICVTAFLVVGIFADNDSAKGFFYSHGLMERAEAFIFFALMIIFPQAFQWLAWLFVVLVLYTAVMHIWRFYRYS